MRPRDLRSAQEAGRWVGASIIPTSDAVARQFVLDARDKDRALPTPPSSDYGNETLRYWRITRGCGE
jgi:hypothetical protein